MTVVLIKRWDKGKIIDHINSFFLFRGTPLFKVNFIRAIVTLIPMSILIGFADDSHEIFHEHDPMDLPLDPHTHFIFCEIPAPGVRIPCGHGAETPVIIVGTRILPDTIICRALYGFSERFRGFFFLFHDYA